jgi:hypothetical protein
VSKVGNERADRSPPPHLNDPADAVRTIARLRSPSACGARILRRGERYQHRPSADPAQEQRSSPLGGWALLIAAGRAGADEHYGRLLVVCEDMRDFALDVGQAWAGRELRPGTVDRPLAILFARTTRTYWATIELLRISFGDQAAMLTRSLFEDMVDMYYTCVEPEAAIDRLPKNAEHADMVMIDALKNDPALLAGEPLPDHDAGRRAELNTLFGPFGEKGWSGLSIRKRVATIMHMWQGDELRTLRFFLDVVNRSNNQTLHMSGAALGSMIRGEDAEGLYLGFGPGPEGVSRGAFAAFWIYSQSLGQIAKHFDFPEGVQERLDRLYLNGWQTFRDHPTA